MNQSIFWDNNEYKIHYQFTGKKDGLITLLIHGLGCDLNYWQPLLQDPKLTSQLGLIAVDLLGYGYSSKPSIKQFDYSMQSQANALALFLRELKVSPDVIIGFSMGGPIAIYLTKMLSSQHLVLVEPTLVENDLSFSKTLAKTPTIMLSLLKIMTYIAPWQFAKSVLHNKDKKAIKIIVNALQQTPATVMKQSSKQLVASATDPETYLSLKKLSSKKTLIIGEFLEKSSSYHPPEDLFEIAKKEVIPNAKHAVMLDNPVAFNEVLLKIINN